MSIYDELTPWGSIQDFHKLSDGVVRVITASHGGLMLNSEIWSQLPKDFRFAAWSPTSPGWKGMDQSPMFAEEDCEQAIVLALLGLDDCLEVLAHFQCEPGAIRESALQTARFLNATRRQSSISSLRRLSRRRA